MPGIVEEAALAGEGLLEAVNHVVERGRDHRGFVLTLHGNALAEVGLGDQPGSGRQRAQGAAHPPGQHQPQERGQHQGDELGEGTRLDGVVDLLPFEGGEVGHHEQGTASRSGSPAKGMAT